MGLFGGISSALVGGRSGGSGSADPNLMKALQGGLKGFMSYIKQDKARKSARLAAEKKRNTLGYNTAEKQVGKGAQTGAELKAQREAAANGEVSTGLGGLTGSLVGGRPDLQAPPIPPVGQGNQEDIMKNNKFANQKMQAVGANLWQGQEMVAQKDAMKSVRSNPVPVPGGSDDSSGNYGDMFMNRSALMNLDDPKSKYKKVNVQDLEDSGSIKSDKKGKYIVNSDEMKTNSSRDTLRLGQNPKHYSGKEYKDKDLIDETDYENFAKDVNKK